MAYRSCKHFAGRPCTRSSGSCRRARDSFLVQQNNTLAPYLPAGSCGSSSLCTSSCAEVPDIASTAGPNSSAVGANVTSNCGQSGMKFLLAYGVRSFRTCISVSNSATFTLPQRMKYHILTREIRTDKRLWAVRTFVGGLKRTNWMLTSGDVDEASGTPVKNTQLYR